MKIAVCLFGLTGGKGGSYGEGKSLDLIKSYENYKKMVFRNHDIDFFAHSWSIEMAENISETYKPKSIIVEKQIDFSNTSFEEYKNPNHKSYEELNRILGKKETISFLKKEIFASHSRWFSLKKSIELMEEYKKKMNIHYDFVLQLRYDLYFLRKIYFLKKLKNKFLCVQKRHNNDHSLYDVTFISSYNDAILFSKIYDDILNYSIRQSCAVVEHLKKLNIQPVFYFNAGDVMLFRDFLKLSKFQKVKLLVKSKLNIIKNIIYFLKSL